LLLCQEEDFCCSEKRRFQKGFAVVLPVTALNVWQHVLHVLL
jgi:hypothetical protein